MRLQRAQVALATRPLGWLGIEDMRSRHSVRGRGFGALQLCSLYWEPKEYKIRCITRDSVMPESPSTPLFYVLAAGLLGVGLVCE